MSTTFDDQLRQAITDWCESNGQTRYQLSVLAGVDPGNVRSFMVRRRSMGIQAVNKLTEAMSLTIVCEQTQPTEKQQ